MWKSSNFYHLFKIIVQNTKTLGSPLVVYVLRFSIFTTMAWVRSLVWELRSHIRPLHTMAKKKEKKTTKILWKDPQETKSGYLFTEKPGMREWEQRRREIVHCILFLVFHFELWENGFSIQNFLNSTSNLHSKCFQTSFQLKKGQFDDGLDSCQLLYFNDQTFTECLLRAKKHI